MPFPELVKVLIPIETGAYDNGFSTSATLNEKVLPADMPLGNAPVMVSLSIVESKVQARFELSPYGMKLLRYG